MYKLLTKNGQLFAFGFGALIVAITVISIVTGIGDDFSTLERAKQFESTAFNFGLYAFFGLVAIAVILMLGFGLLHVFSDLKGSMKGIIGFGAMILIFVIARSMANPQISESIAEQFNITDGISQTISGAMITMMVLLAIAVLAFILSEIRNFFK